MKNSEQKIFIPGLTEKEADVYLSVLSLGKATITDIARKSFIKRTSVYIYLKSLLQKDLISQTVFKKRIFYVAENPEKLTFLLQRRETSLTKERQVIEKILPELSSLFVHSFSKPNIFFYEGKNGIRLVYEKVLNHHKKIYSFFSPRKFFQMFSHKENKEIISLLEINGGILLNLVEKSDMDVKQFKIQEYKSFVRHKLLPKNFSFETDFLIAGDLLAMISFDKQIAVIIEDSAITHLQKQLFLTLWKNPKNLQK